MAEQSAQPARVFDNGIAKMISQAIGDEGFINAMMREGMADMKIGKDGKVQMNFDPRRSVTESLGARQDASQQAGPTSLAGIMDPTIMKMIAGIQEEGLQRADQFMPQMSQANYQTALAREASRGPQRDMLNMIMALAGDEAAMARTRQQGADAIAARKVPQAITPEEQALLRAKANYYNNPPAAGKQPSAALVGLPSKLAESWEYMTRDKDGNPITPSSSQLKLFEEAIKPYGFGIARYAFKTPKSWGGLAGGDPVIVDLITPEGNPATKSELLEGLISKGVSEKDAITMIDGMNKVK